MPTTPTYSLPYPAATDPADVPVDMGELAVAVEAASAAAVAAPAAGDQLAYQEFTTNKTFTATTEATAATIVTAPTVTLPVPTTVWVEFFCPASDQPTATAFALVLFNGSAVQGKIAAVYGAASSLDVPILVRRALTLSGSLVFSIRAHFTFGTGTATMQAGAGGPGVYVPGYIRVTRG